MSVLETLYASAGSDIIYITLSITDGTTTHNLIGGWEDITATLEDSSVVTFTACGMETALPTRNSDGTQDIKFALCNIDGSVSSFIRANLATNTKMNVTLRQFVSSDLSAPAENPLPLEIKSGQWTATQATITAGYFNLLDTAWPRKLFTNIDYPGLRYIS